MFKDSYFFTSESVSEGHPDKVCDRISDEIVDMVYREAAKSGLSSWDVRVACEVLATTNKVVIAGEARLPPSLLLKDSSGNIICDASGPQIDKIPFQEVTREAIRKIGYEQEGFHWRTVDIDILLHSQSSDIAQGVDNAADLCDAESENSPHHEGAGDQGIMFGYACTETEAFMPAPIYYSHKILAELARARHAKEGDAALLGPDAKTQVTILYKNGAPCKVTKLVLSTQHLDPEWSSAKVREVVEPYIRRALQEIEISDDCEWYINPTGKFVIGGPDGDAGLTGRKIIVDSYGGAAPHGGGAFSGKDTTKVDRSGAYAARYLAKNIVAAGLASRCTIQLSYAIGVACPLAIYVNTHKSGKIADKDLCSIIPQLMDLSPSGIREHLDLNKPIYAVTAAYGHFGRETTEEGHFSWERLDLVEKILDLTKNFARKSD